MGLSPGITTCFPAQSLSLSCFHNLCEVATSDSYFRKVQVFVMWLGRKYFRLSVLKLFFSSVGILFQIRKELLHCYLMIRLPITSSS